ncbi:MAG: hypothetical protein ACREBU_26780 [Nitrososphaera sp.]
MKKLLFVITTMLGSVSAHAACSTSDLAGTWYFFVTAAIYGPDLSNPPDGVADAFEVTIPYRCKVVVNNAGIIIVASSWCKLPNDPTNVPKPTDVGIANENVTLRINSACNIRGTGVEGNPVVGQLSRDKITAHGLSRRGDIQWRVWSAVKR